MDLNLYAVLTPALLLLIAAEFAYCLYVDNGYYNFADSMANMGTAIGNQVVNVAVGLLVVAGYSAVHARFGLADLSGPAAGVLLFLGVDFFFYWFHRYGHEIHILWAAHSPHHSSEELNYTVGARASVTQRLASFIFYLPLALFFKPETLVPAVLLHHVMQFWPHTRAIGRLPRWFETVFNCPSHHRVHHAINDHYLDKNYGGVLIVWDKLFGTFEPEVETPVFGLRPPIRSLDPVEINLYYYKKLWSWARQTPYWSDRLKLPFMGLDWRPRGVERPAGPSWRKEGHVKDEPVVDRRTRLILLAQLPAALFFMALVTRAESPLGPAGKLAAAGAVWLIVASWGRRLEAGRSRGAPAGPFRAAQEGTRSALARRPASALSRAS